MKIFLLILISIISIFPLTMFLLFLNDKLSPIIIYLCSSTELKELDKLLKKKEFNEQDIQKIENIEKKIDIKNYNNRIHNFQKNLIIIYSTVFNIVFFYFALTNRSIFFQGLANGCVIIFCYFIFFKKDINIFGFDHKYPQNN